MALYITDKLTLRGLDNKENTVLVDLDFTTFMNLWRWKKLEDKNRVLEILTL